MRCATPRPLSPKSRSSPPSNVSNRLNWPRALMNSFQSDPPRKTPSQLKPSPHPPQCPDFPASAPHISPVSLWSLALVAKLSLLEDSSSALLCALLPFVEDPIAIKGSVLPPWASCREGLTLALRPKRCYGMDPIAVWFPIKKALLLRGLPLFCCWAAQAAEQELAQSLAVPLYTEGQKATNDVITPLPLIVLDADRTEKVRETEARRIPVFATYFPEVIG